MAIYLKDEKWIDPAKELPCHNQDVYTKHSNGNEREGWYDVSGGGGFRGRYGGSLFNVVAWMPRN